MADQAHRPTQCTCGNAAALVLTAPCPALQGYEEAGTDLAQLLNKKETITAQKAAMSPDIAKALAKLANGLYVVTAAHSAQVGSCLRVHWGPQAAPGLPSWQAAHAVVAIGRGRWSHQGL